MEYIIDIVWLLVSASVVFYYSKELINCIENRPLSKTTITFALLFTVMFFIKITISNLNQIMSW